MIHPIILTKISEAECVELQHIGKTTFFETFSLGIPDENMDKYLQDSFSIGKLTDELQHVNSSFYFASIDSQVVGYLKLNWGDAQSELQDIHALEIERIYVLRDFQRMQVGQALYKQALLIAQQKRLHYIWLGVWEENYKAMHFYEKNGFVVFDKHTFKFGDKEETDLMMKKVVL